MSSLFTPQSATGWWKEFAVVVFSGSLHFFHLTLHIFSFLQEDLQQLILMPLPNVAILGQDPLTGTR